MLLLLVFQFNFRQWSWNTICNA